MDWIAGLGVLLGMALVYMEAKRRNRQLRGAVDGAAER